MLDRTNPESLSQDENNHFIISTSHEKPSTNLRKLIRSHVMRGKNRRKCASPVEPGTWINGNSSGFEHAQDCDILACPQRLLSGSGLSTLQYAESMEPYMYDLIWTSFNIIMKAVYPIELCLHFNPKNSVWFEYLQTDATYLHSQMWLAQSYIDWTHGYEPSRKALLHQNTTFNLLRQRLLDPNLATLDTTISVVVTLVNMSAMSGSVEEARHHMDGLHKMVSMRGGVSALKQNTQLQLKVCRADLSTALLNGKTPLFFGKDISCEPYLPPPTAYQLSQLTTLPTDDSKLLNIYSDLQTFTISTNIAFQSTQKLSPTLFQETLISVQYRLSSLSYPFKSTEHILRLALLAFSTSIFLQRRGIRARFRHLSAQLYVTIIHKECFTEFDLELKIWILVMAGIVAVNEEDDFWISPLLREELNDHVELRKWGELRRVLKRVLWIDVLHDQDGMRVLERMSDDGGSSDTV